MEIIDAHAHIYPAKIAEKATVAIGEFYDIKGDVTVPQIIVDGVRIGGYDDLMADPKVVLG